MADDKKEPRWANDPPPGFAPGGKSLIAPADQVKWPETKIKAPDGTLYTPEEYEAKFPGSDVAAEAKEEPDDLSDLDELDEIA